MGKNRKHFAKYVETDPAAVMRCILRAVAITDTRTGLIEIWQGAKHVTTGKDLQLVIDACKARQGELVKKGIISL